MRHCLAGEYKTKIIKLELIITYFLTFKKGGLFLWFSYSRWIEILTEGNTVFAFRTIYRLLAMLIIEIRLGEIRLILPEEALIN